MQADPFSRDDSARLVAEVERALRERRPLRIRGGDTKAFLGRPVAGDEIDTRTHRGVVSYDPTELVVTARAGTPLAELTAVLEASGQMLPCEPPAFGEAATVGGMVASGLSGPRRPWAGAVRDYVLGCRVVTGHGKHLRFGGEVMKNVAGYDVSRLLAGSQGCLGLITEVSLKVLPQPRARESVVLELDAAEALRRLSAWRRAALPVSGACHVDGRLHVRLEGGAGSVTAALAGIGGAPLDAAFWDDLREHRLAFFADPRPLWRLSVPATAPLAPLPGDALIDWAGAQRWLKSEADAGTIRALATAAGGHATRFRAAAQASGSNITDTEIFTPLAAPLLRLHQRVKQQLDPQHLFNPGRLYAEL
ncbi:glycolate oxidase subunit GlcE [Burkholderia sp. WAC0059]|uniref:glycolate oxidase subunit GlcE n=1 Tax=Burkholderia sp. WAC0059 TaxID=2066022 RepID=UPI000C7EBEAF|nr:glycolate oxidase subunit GlcE [Burkholderia sp. WAC0059]PLZ04279.1 glycolate oxidase subunit GlcE [Burkholderia sp. WAC0059]